MKILQLILSLLIIIDFMKISLCQDELDLITMKRPFCNAFTGCGRKRDPSYAGPGYDNVAVPLPVYRVLLRFVDARMRQRHPQVDPDPIF